MSWGVWVCPARALWTARLRAQRKSTDATQDASRNRTAGRQGNAVLYNIIYLLHVYCMCFVSGAGQSSIRYIPVQYQVCRVRPWTKPYSIPSRKSDLRRYQVSAIPASPCPLEPRVACAATWSSVACTLRARCGCFSDPFSDRSTRTVKGTPSSDSCSVKAGTSVAHLPMHLLRAQVLMQ